MLQKKDQQPKAVQITAGLPTCLFKWLANKKMDVCMADEVLLHVSFFSFLFHFISKVMKNVLVIQVRGSVYVYTAKNIF